MQVEQVALVVAVVLVMRQEIKLLETPALEMKVAILQ